MKVLIVDDLASNRKLLRLNLEANQITVGEATDGLVALAMLASEAFDAIISDLLMPGMDGYRLFREIRGDPRLRELPIIALTSIYASLGDEELALRSGADRFFSKPVPTEILLQALAELHLPGVTRRPELASLDDPLVMQEYNSVLVRKLEEKSQELAERNAQLRALAGRNESIREHERTTVAREIHDVLAQQLTCLKIDLVWVARRAALPIDESTRESITRRISDAIGQTDAAITTVQRIATDLRPVVLDSLGLPAAVEWQVEDFARRADLICHIRLAHVKTRLNRECATAMFRILQESLTNIARHAHASKIDVELVEEPECVVLVVADNGCGITAAQLTAARSIGLVGMRERAEALGGSLEIGGSADEGTTIRVRMPVCAPPEGGAG